MQKRYKEYKADMRMQRKFVKMYTKFVQNSNKTRTKLYKEYIYNDNRSE
jgi:hypothetical protein